METIFATCGNEHEGFAAEYGQNDRLYLQGRWFKDEHCLCADRPAKEKLRGAALFKRLLLNK